MNDDDASTGAVRPGGHPDDDALLALLRGDVGPGRTAHLTDHLRGCGSCRLRLVDVARTHAALASAALLARHEGAVLPDDGDVALPRLAPLPDLDDEALVAPAAPRPGPAAPRHRGRRALVAAACAVVLAAALTGAYRLGGQRSPASTAASDRGPTPSRTVRLQPVVGQASGAVSMAQPAGGTLMTITTAGLPRLPSGEFYYAWLFDPTTQKMLPLGVVSGTSPATFRVPTVLVGRYHAVDISLQDDDGNPRHSATSVLRAAY